MSHLYLDLLARCGASPDLAAQFWRTLDEGYAHPKRFYHNWAHLAQMLEMLEPFRPQVEDWDVLLLALFYHDAVYNVRRSDNEAQSAALASAHLQSIGFSTVRIERCKAHILATKGHAAAQDSDTDLFTDADLSILGAPWEVYQQYAQNIRKEYGLFPDIVYRPGRRKVLEHFLAMPHIYKTPVFQAEREVQARENLQREKDLRF